MIYDFGSEDFDSFLFSKSSLRCDTNIESKDCRILFLNSRFVFLSQDFHCLHYTLLRSFDMKLPHCLRKKFCLLFPLVNKPWNPESLDLDYFSRRCSRRWCPHHSELPTWLMIKVWSLPRSKLHLLSNQTRTLKMSRWRSSEWFSG